MGKDIYENFDVAKRVFDIASNITGIDLVQVCFQGPKEDLADTMLCQVAIFIVSVACFQSMLFYMKQNNIDFECVAMAGLSLGEYTALASSGCLSFEDAITLVHKRGQYMKEVADDKTGAMASVLGLDEEKVAKVCELTGVEMANINCPGQIVISGTKKTIDEAINIVKEKFKARIIPLNVTGAYHSSLMNPAKDKLKKFINKIKFNPPNTLFISNATGQYYIDPEDIKKNLITQLSSSVYWQKSMGLMLDTGITGFLEIGPGKVLSGLLRRIDNSLHIYNIETKKDIVDSIRDLEFREE